MKTPAYDECYLESMILKTRYLFQLLARNGGDVFEGIKSYMEGEYRLYMDQGNPLYLNKTPKQILSSLGMESSPSADISEEYDEFILEWMADVYTYTQWKYAVASREIIEKIQPEELYHKYYPLHEASLDNCAEKLMKW